MERIPSHSRAHSLALVRATSLDLARLRLVARYGVVWLELGSVEHCQALERGLSQVARNILVWAPDQKPSRHKVLNGFMTQAVADTLMLAELHHNRLRPAGL